jgi:hypothetical protein
LPSLHGATTIRFSPDGHYLVAQDASGLYILTKQPLARVFYVDSANAYPAAFSFDSRALYVLGQDLILEAWQLSDGKLLEHRDMQLSNGCLDAQLSPGGEWIACLTPELRLDLFQTSTFKRAYSDAIEPARPPFGYNVIPLHKPSAFSGSFGMVMSSNLAPLANRRYFSMPSVFSPDGKMLIARSLEKPLYRLDLASLKKINLPGPLRNHEIQILASQSGDRVLVQTRKDESSASILSWQSGEVLSVEKFAADAASIATNPRYALLSKAEVPDVAVFDLTQNAPVGAPPNISADVYESTLAVFTETGELQLYDLNHGAQGPRGRLPIDMLPGLYSATVDPSLSTIAFSVQGASGIFDSASGARLAPAQLFVNANFSSPHAAQLLKPRIRSDFYSVVPWAKDDSSVSAKPAWIAADQRIQFFAGAGVLFEYSLDRDRMVKVPENRLDGQEELPYLIRALEFATGRELWKRRYLDSPPILYTDPQGRRIVLAWKARSHQALGAAKGSSAAESLKKLKLKDQDTYFEVLDSRSGSPVGGALVQFGAGPAAFDSAFSSGDALFLVKDQLRVTMIDLKTGKILARIRGDRPSVSAEVNLFTLNDAAGLNFYDLSSGAKLACRPVNDPVAYSRFSDKGDRLLVLTAHQNVYILDVKKTLASFAVPITTDQHEPSE